MPGALQLNPGVQITPAGVQLSQASSSLSAFGTNLLGGGVTSPAMLPTGFLLLADGSSKLLLANGASKFERIS